MMTQDKIEIDLLLVGKTGNGKSALGNSILNRNFFKSKACSFSVTDDIQAECSEVNGRIITVVDGPGVGGTSMDSVQSTEKVMNAMAEAIAENDSGYHGFLLVVKFGGRFTKEDKDTVDFLKKLFGDNFVKQFCILVMNCGDIFDNESEEPKQTFEEWCKDQQGVFSELMNECNKRVVLFDNKTKDETKKHKQIETLFKMVDKLTFEGHRYTNENFKKAREARERLMLEAKKPIISNETLKETSLIIQKLQQLQTTADEKNNIVELNELMTRATALHVKIKSQDNGTGALHDLVQTVQDTVSFIDLEIKLINRLAEERERLRKLMEEKHKKHEEEFNRPKQEYQHLIEAHIIEEGLDKQKIKELEQRLQRLEFERKTEIEKLRKEIEQKMAKERKEKKTTEELMAQYQKAKEKNNKGFFSSLSEYLRKKIQQNKSIAKAL